MAIKQGPPANIEGALYVALDVSRTKADTAQAIFDRIDDLILRYGFLPITSYTNLKCEFLPSGLVEERK